MTAIEKSILTTIINEKFEYNKIFKFYHFENMVKEMEPNITFETILNFIYESLDEEIISQIYTGESYDNFIGDPESYDESKSIYLKKIA